MTPATKSVKSKSAAKTHEKNLGFSNLEEAVHAKYGDLLILLDRFKDKITVPGTRNK